MFVLRKPMQWNSICPFVLYKQCNYSTAMSLYSNTNCILCITRSSIYFLDAEFEHICIQMVDAFVCTYLNMFSLHFV